MNATIFEGNLTIYNQLDAEKYKHLTEITGDLTIYSPAELQALTRAPLTRVKQQPEMSPILTKGE